jgi:predicted RNA-binding protein YlxR (DUF448 family)
MDQNKKKIPERQCLGCNEHRPKNELLRVVRPPESAGDQTVSLDFTGKKSGRGAYVCRELKCLQRARKSKRLERILECEISEAVYDAMEQELSEHGE